MRKQIKLKPCPFCGSIPTVETHQFYASHYVRCKGCNVTTPPNSDIKIAVKLWNRRAGEQNERTD